MKTRPTGRATSRSKSLSGKAAKRQAGIAAKKPAAGKIAIKRGAGTAAVAKAGVRKTTAVSGVAQAESAARAELGSILARIHRNLDETETLLAD